MDSGSRRTKGRLIADINITPFVDVMLVLLVIFMITAPLIYNSVELKLPKTNRTNKVNFNGKQVVLSMTRSGDYYIGKQKFLANEIIPTIKEQFKENHTDVLYIRADHGLNYGKVAKMMTYLRINGVINIALVTEVEQHDKPF